MRKILNLTVLGSFFCQQATWAMPPLAWKPDFESASVLPYYVERTENQEKTRTWVLLSKKTYLDPDYDSTPSWSDFGGIMDHKEGSESETPAQAAARELIEETNKQITTTAEELLTAPFHQIDMKKAPFGKGELFRRHTIFFKEMEKKDTFTIEEGINKGPCADGSREISRYQWMLVDDLLSIPSPSHFGSALGLYDTNPKSINLENNYLLIPFFVLLQQSGVQDTLKSLSKSKTNDITKYQQTFSQIVFTRSGFQDWRLVHQDKMDLKENPLDIGAVKEEIDHLESKRQSLLEVKYRARKHIKILGRTIAKNSGGKDAAQKHLQDLEKKLRELNEQLLPLENELSRFTNAYGSILLDPQAAIDGDKRIGTVGLKVSRNQRNKETSNTWSINKDSELSPKQRNDADALIKTYGDYQQVLKAITAENHKKIKRNIKLISTQDEQKQQETQKKVLDEIEKVKKEQKSEYSTKKSSSETRSIASLPTMTDAHLKHLLGNDIDLKNMEEVLTSYQEKANCDVSNPDFVKAVKGVLTKEQEHREMFTAYHGCPAEIHFLQTLYSVLAPMLGLEQKKIYWRLFDQDFGRYGHIAPAFSDTTQSNNQRTKFVNQYDMLISANAALTGNHHVPGSRTLTYWKESHAANKIDLKQMLRGVLTSIGLSADISDNLVKQLNDVYEESYLVDGPQSGEKVKAWILRQIFFKPKSLDNKVALSGDSNDRPLSFADRILPGGATVSIYDELEERDHAWMKNLPDAERFMIHIRAGHSQQMEKILKPTRKKYRIHSINGI